MLVLVSACLLGINCRYNGSNVYDDSLLSRIKEYDLIPIPICPEQLGGLPTPRECCEIVGGDGFDVLKGKAKVISRSGKDLTEYFVRGAYETLKIAKLLNVKKAIMKNFSPSCGCGKIYDGTFSGKKKKGWGVTSALLLLNGVEVSDNLK